MKRATGKSFFALAAGAFLSLAPFASQAQIVVDQATLPSCVTTSGPEINCKDTAFIDAGFLSSQFYNADSTFIGSPTLPGSSMAPTFTDAFKAWNDANGGLWTLQNGGILQGVSIKSVLFGPAASQDMGGDFVAGGDLILITLNGSRKKLANLVWTQALFINYTPVLGPLPAPIVALDTFDLSQNGSNPDFPKTCVAASSGASPSGGAFCGPIYPFQYGTMLRNQTFAGVPFGVDPFFDAPTGLWPDASDDAIVLLSQVDSQTHTLTVFQGLGYGFVLSVPEPSTWALFLLALPAMFVLRHNPHRLMSARSRERSRREEQASPASRAYS
jgi:hypothetical protein